MVPYRSLEYNSWEVAVDRGDREGQARVWGTVGMAPQHRVGRGEVRLRMGPPCAGDVAGVGMAYFGRRLVAEGQILGRRASSYGAVEGADQTPTKVGRVGEGVPSGLGRGVVLVWMMEVVPRQSEVETLAVVESPTAMGAAVPKTEEAGCAGRGSAGARVRLWEAVALWTELLPKGARRTEVGATQQQDAFARHMADKQVVAIDTELAAAVPVNGQDSDGKAPGASLLPGCGADSGTGGGSIPVRRESVREATRLPI